MTAAWWAIAGIGYLCMWTLAAWVAMQTLFSEEDWGDYIAIAMLIGLVWPLWIALAPPSGMVLLMGRIAAAPQIKAEKKAKTGK